MEQKTFFSRANEAPVGTLMTIGDVNDISPIRGVALDFEGVRTRRMFRALKALQSRGLWGHATPEKFEI